MSVRRITRAVWRRVVAVVLVVVMSAPAFSTSAYAAAPQQSPTGEEVTFKEVAQVIGFWTVALGVIWLLSIPARHKDAKSRASVTNTRFEQVSPELIHVYYDLSAVDSSRRFVVKLEASADGGRSYKLKVRSATGDVGEGIEPGAGKLIAWQASVDVPPDQPLDLKFRVTVKAMKQ